MSSSLTDPEAQLALIWTVLQHNIVIAAEHLASDIFWILYLDFAASYLEYSMDLTSP